jgi:hypothetical protein
MYVNRACRRHALQLLLSSQDIQRRLLSENLDNIQPSITSISVLLRPTILLSSYTTMAWLKFSIDSGILPRDDTNHHHVLSWMTQYLTDIDLFHAWDKYTSTRHVSQVMKGIVITISNITIPVRYFALCAASRHDNPVMFRILLTDEIIINLQFIKVIAGNKSIQCLSILLEKHPIPHKYTLEDLIEYPSLIGLIWTKGLIPTRRTKPWCMQLANRDRNLPVIISLYKHRFTPRGIDCMAAGSGALQILQWYMNQGLPMNHRIWLVALENNKEGVWRAILDVLYNSNVPWDIKFNRLRSPTTHIDMGFLYYYALDNHVDFLLEKFVWLYEHHYLLAPEILTLAIDRRHDEVFEWLMTLEDMPINTSHIVSASRSSLSMLQRLHDKGVPWPINGQVFIEMMEDDDPSLDTFECAQWALDHGCPLGPFQRDDIEYFIEHRHRPIYLSRYIGIRHVLTSWLQRQDVE